MTEEKLFSVLIGSYHDGALLNAKCVNNSLYMYCHRNPPDPEGKEDPNTRYVIIRFDNVTELEVFDWKETEEFIPYRDDSFYKPDGFWAISGIVYLTCVDGLVEFGECLRFRCDGVELLESSSEEMDFSKYLL
ncbi:MAG: hypothetical protein J6D16_05320 [Clostridia bacterium]|nr:hypothetical protein [Clostridia bacterium]